MIDILTNITPSYRQPVCAGKDLCEYPYTVVGEPPGVLVTAGKSRQGSDDDGWGTYLTPPCAVQIPLAPQSSIAEPNYI